MFTESCSCGQGANQPQSCASVGIGRGLQGGSGLGCLGFPDMLGAGRKSQQISSWVPFDKSRSSLHRGRELNDGLTIREQGKDAGKGGGQERERGGRSRGGEGWMGKVRAGVSPLSAMGLEKMTVQGSRLGAGQSRRPHLPLSPGALPVRQRLWI